MVIQDRDGRLHYVPGRHLLRYAALLLTLGRAWYAYQSWNACYLDPQQQVGQGAQDQATLLDMSPQTYQ